MDLIDEELVNRGELEPDEDSKDLDTNPDPCKPTTS